MPRGVSRTVCAVFKVSCFALLGSSVRATPGDSAPPRRIWVGSSKRSKGVRLAPRDLWPCSPAPFGPPLRGTLRAAAAVGGFETSARYRGTRHWRLAPHSSAFLRSFRCAAFRSYPASWLGWARAVCQGYCHRVNCHRAVLPGSGYPPPHVPRKSLRSLHRSVHERSRAGRRREI